MDWKNHFRHHTAAWREEVENNLRKTGHEVSAGNGQAANDRLGSEMGMNSALRAMQLRVEEATADNEADSTRQFENLAGAMGAGVQNVLAGEEAAKAKQQRAADQAEDAMNRNEASQGAAVDGVRSGQQSLSSKAAELRKNVRLAGAELTSMFALPKLSMSKQNKATDAKAGEVNAQLAKLAAQQASLLEEHASIAKAKLMNAPDTPEAESAEEKAVEKLNEELDAENSKLSTQNQKLETGLERKEKQLEVMKHQHVQ